jgi:hypothetical protein
MAYLVVLTSIPSSAPKVSCIIEAEVMQNQPLPVILVELGC